MKKLLFSLSFLLSLFTAQAQVCGGPALIDEKFDNGIPGSWTILNLDGNTLYWNMPSKGYTGAWQSFQHNGRKCIANTSRFTPSGGADDYLISPQITLGGSPICLSWKGSTYNSQFTENYEIRISTTTPDAAGMLANPSLAVISNDLPEWMEHTVDLSAYAGQTVYLGFWYNSNSQYAIYLDDIRLSQPVNIDASVSTVDFGDVILPAPQVIKGILQNAGLNAITSLDVNWNVNNGPVSTMNLPSVSIPASSFYSFTHSINWTPSLNGQYTVKVWTSNVNGGQDQYTGNDTLISYVFVNNFPRKILLEEFTQASCPPCGTLNPGFDSIVQPNITGNKVTSVKYHCIWPGVDPMNSFNMGDVEQRVQYYGIDGIPIGLSDGHFLPSNGNCDLFNGPNGCGQMMIDSARLIPSIFDIQLSETKVGNTMNISVTIIAKSDIPLTSFKLMTMVVEDTIIYNVAPGTNGEVEFPQVLRKILPDSLGQSLGAMTNNQSLTFNYSYPVNTSSCMLSEMRTIAFIQDDLSRHVYQSENTSPHMTGISELNNVLEVNVFPNPSSGKLFIRMEGSFGNDVSWRMCNLIGEELRSGRFTVAADQNLDISSLSRGIYFLKLTSGSCTTSVKVIRE